jgi:CheY-like chemotaxis protein
LVEAMGGEIGIESVPGIGSLFWFEVPLALGDYAALKVAARRESVAVPSRCVLLVEDVELNRKLIAEMLTAHGHHVTLAMIGQEAVELVAREPFDVVLMDVQMPVMDGEEATRMIRRLPPPAGEMPVFALSANVMAAERERYLRAGMNGALAKPINWQQLFEVLRQCEGPGQGTVVQQDVTDPGADLPARRAAAMSPIDAKVLDRLRELQAGNTDLTANWQKSSFVISDVVWRSCAMRWAVRTRQLLPGQRTR